MAKQYIPGVSGLLTETNPADSPSNTLTGAENVIVDQNGKIQARHGLNVNQDESSNSFLSNYSDTLQTTNLNFIPKITDPDITFNDTLTDYVHYSSFFNNGNIFLKLFEIKTDNNEIITGLLVKQNKNEYITNTSSNIVTYLSKNTSELTSVYRYYKIDSETGKLIQMNQLPLTDIQNSFNTKHSNYIQTLDGLYEANIDDLFVSTEDRYMKIEWPPFPELTHTFTISDIYANWLKTNYKFGIKITYYKELGYSDEEDNYYESEPSQVYEIINSKSDGIPKLTLTLLSMVDSTKKYLEWNKFTTLNNKRKFGIKIYRTKSVPINEALPVEYYECSLQIPFNTQLSGKLTYNSDAIVNGLSANLYTIENVYNSSSSSSAVLNVDDLFYYIPTNKKIDNSVTNFLYEKKNVRYLDNNNDFDDLQYAKIQVIYRNFSNGSWKYAFKAVNDIFENGNTTAILKSNEQWVNTSTVSKLEMPIIRYFDIELVNNDNALTSSGGQELYTNPGIDGNENSNLIVPNSENIIPFKDFYIHATITNPLETSLSVISQPTVEQRSFLPYITALTGNFYKTKTCTIPSTFTNLVFPSAHGFVVGNALYINLTDNPNLFGTGFDAAYYNVFLYVVESVNSTTIKVSTVPGGTPVTLTTAAININIVINYYEGGDQYSFSKNYLIGTKLDAYDNTDYKLDATDPPGQSVNLNGEVFIESEVLGKRRYKVSSTYDILSPKLPYYGDVLYFNTALSDWKLTVSATSDFDYALFLNIATFKATIFEKPFLTLRLTSLSSQVTDISVQLEPIYNRNGAYQLTGKNNIFDSDFLTYDKGTSDSNSYINATTKYRNTNISNHIYNEIGDGDGQVSPHGLTVLTGSTAITNSLNPDIYFNTTDNTLTIIKSVNFDINLFEQPGIILLQTERSTQTGKTSTLLISYQSYEISNSKYIFKKAIPQYMGGEIYNPNEISPSLNSVISSFDVSSRKIYYFYLKGTNVDNLPLYTKTLKTTVGSYESKHYFKFDSTTSMYGLLDSSTDIPGNFENIVSLGFLPHRKRSSIPISIFSKQLELQFLGIAKKEAGELLDSYAWQIINKFNVELQKNQIVAYLKKGVGIGEINIVYPNGKSISMMNGKYDAIKSIYPGNHTFLPALPKLEFIKLTEKKDTPIVHNNLAYISRRNLPEITTYNSYITIGKNTKKIIGYAQNVDDLFIFKEDGIFRLIDNGNISSDIPLVTVSQFSTTLICQSGGSIKEINDEIIFLSQYGFISINNGNVENISGSIQNDILTLLKTSPSNRIRSFVNESKQLYYCTLINEIDTTLNVKSGTYIFNTKTRQWSFMDQEILDGLEDYKGRNLVAYRQKSVVGIYNSASYSYWTSNSKTHKLLYSSFSYPLTNSTLYNNFYYISRERHTNNLINNPVDQYDYVSEDINITNVTSTTNGLKISLQVSQNAFTYHYAQKLFKLFTPPSTIYTGSNSTNIIIDSPIQFFVNRYIYIELTRNNIKEYYEVKLLNHKYNGTLSSPTTSYINEYEFEYLTSNKPTNFTGVTNIRVLAGIPTKLTFNPESGKNPDSNKLFQEYLVHTQTNNKALRLSFKTDGQSNYTPDRPFAYDKNNNNRTVFRAYIPIQASRGRYLIRQVKHDVPLENLIITGQTIVMRDSGNTRVQQDKDVD